MSDLIAVAYPDRDSAETVRSHLVRLTAEHAIGKHDVAFAHRRGPRIALSAAS